MNEQLGLMMIHTIMLREHNDVDSHWDKERVFQETRKIVGDLIQHITYNEFLPRVLGPQYALDLLSFSNSGSVIGKLGTYCFLRSHLTFM